MIGEIIKLNNNIEIFCRQTKTLRELHYVLISEQKEIKIIQVLIQLWQDYSYREQKPEQQNN